jgi:hypothetical protein
LTFLGAPVILSRVMVQSLTNATNPQVLNSQFHRRGFNPVPNAKSLSANIINQLKKFACLSLLLLNERLESVGNEFLGHPAIKSLSVEKKLLIIIEAQEIFNQTRPLNLTRQTLGAVNELFGSLFDAVALEGTGQIAKENNITTVKPPRAILQAASAKQGTMEMFCERLVELLEKTRIHYPGGGIVPDVNHSLAELLEPHLDSMRFDRESRKNPLRDLLIRILRVADAHFKLEKDYKEPESYDPFSSLWNDLRRRGDAPSNYEGLGGLCSEQHSITLRKDFAKELEELLQGSPIMEDPPTKFKKTRYPYLNTLALEAATDKILNPFRIRYTSSRG